MTRHQPTSTTGTQHGTTLTVMEADDIDLDDPWAAHQHRLEQRPDLPGLMTQQEVSAFLRMHRTTIGSLTRSGAIKASNVGTDTRPRWRYRREHVLEYLEGAAVLSAEGCGCTGQLPDAGPPAP